jgi:hypothetical protein
LAIAEKMTLLLGCLLFRFLGVAWGFDPIEQYTGRLIVGVLGDECASEGFGEEGGSQSIDVLTGFLVLGFDPIDFGEEGFDAADDFVLFF